MKPSLLTVASSRERPAGESREPHPNDIRAELRRVAVSRTFSQARHCCLLLDYLVRHPESSRFTTRSIGMAVFGRPASFNPVNDPVVSIQLARLRTKLTDYYADEGRDNPLRIRLLAGDIRVRVEAAQAPVTPLPPSLRIVAGASDAQQAPKLGLAGVKAAFELTQHALSIKQQGIDFVVRYYSHQSGKNLSLAEARALTDAGLQIGVVWETIGAHLHSFSRAQGLADGAAAYLMAHAVITQPSGSAIYFEVDCNPTAGDIEGPITRYFEGVNQAFNAARPGEPKYRVGVYGSASCCQAMVRAGLASFSSLAPVDTATRGASDYPLHHLRQTGSETLTVDEGRKIMVDMTRGNDAAPAGLFRVL